MGNRMILIETSHDPLVEDGFIVVLNKIRVLLAKSSGVDIGWVRFNV